MFSQHFFFVGLGNFYSFFVLFVLSFVLQLSVELCFVERDIIEFMLYHPTNINRIEYTLTTPTTTTKMSVLKSSILLLQTQTIELQWKNWRKKEKKKELE
jgi:hypothetical protein